MIASPYNPNKHFQKVFRRLFFPPWRNNGSQTSKERVRIPPRNGSARRYGFNARGGEGRRTLSWGRVQSWRTWESSGAVAVTAPTSDGFVPADRPNGPARAVRKRFRTYDWEFKGCFRGIEFGADVPRGALTGEAAAANVDIRRLSGSFSTIDADPGALRGAEG